MKFQKRPLKPTILAILIMGLVTFLLNNLPGIIRQIEAMLK
jgi:hypothetical protein